MIRTQYKIAVHAHTSAWLHSVYLAWREDLPNSLSSTTHLHDLGQVHAHMNAAHAHTATWFHQVNPLSKLFTVISVYAWPGPKIRSLNSSTRTLSSLASLSEREELPNYLPCLL